MELLSTNGQLVTNQQATIQQVRRTGDVSTALATRCALATASVPLQWQKCGKSPGIRRPRILGGHKSGLQSSVQVVQKAVSFDSTTRSGLNRNMRHCSGEQRRQKCQSAATGGTEPHRKKSGTCACHVKKGRVSDALTSRKATTHPPKQFSSPTVVTVHQRTSSPPRVRWKVPPDAKNLVNS